jgi:BirA family biotin operon repressor/biotin-[acetyl-CoA-carboxylase] ligase
MIDDLDIDLDEVGSTQDEVHALLDIVARGTVVAVSAQSQREGRGREQRVWVDPPGEQLALSIGVADASTTILDTLPQRVAAVLLAAIADPRVEWKLPNDLVESKTGAKVCGVLIDARSTGPRSRIVIGIGLNVTGGPFAIGPRAATTLEAIGINPDRSELRGELVHSIRRLLRGV